MLLIFSGGSRGGSGGLLEPPFEAKLFHFHGDLFEKLGKTNICFNEPPFVNLNPLSRNRGSAPDLLPIFLSFPVFY